MAASFPFSELFAADTQRDLDARVCDAVRAAVGGDADVLRKLFEWNLVGPASITRASVPYAAACANCLGHTMRRAVIDAIVAPMAPSAAAEFEEWADRFVWYVNNCTHEIWDSLEEGLHREAFGTWRIDTFGGDVWAWMRDAYDAEPEDIDGTAYCRADELRLAVTEIVARIVESDAYALYSSGYEKKFEV